MGSLAGTGQQRARFHLLRRSAGLQPYPLLIAESRERLIAAVGHQLSLSARRVRWPAGPGGWPSRGIPRAAVRCPRGAGGAAAPVSASLCLIRSVLVALVSSCRG
jgi:hypothetical protein